MFAEETPAEADTCVALAVLSYEQTAKHKSTFMNTVNSSSNTLQVLAK